MLMKREPSQSSRRECSSNGIVETVLAPQMHRIAIWEDLIQKEKWLLSHRETVKCFDGVGRNRRSFHIRGSRPWSGCHYLGPRLEHSLQGWLGLGGR
ncbi:uncharacterized protein DS421_7g220210 [Arachis hypogaea]|nr:uncharacterized protein DS421_7g220210 [Arachis hypogaea]